MHAGSRRMMQSKAEINLQRLLRSCEKMGEEMDDEELAEDAKLKSYVTSLRQQLSALLGEGVHQSLPSISGSKAAEYRNRIDALSQKLGKQKELSDSAVRGENKESGQGEGKGEEAIGAAVSPSSNASQGAPTTRPSTLRQRQKGGATKNESPGTWEKVDASGNSSVSRLDASAERFIQKHRELQETLTDEMVELAGQLKLNSLMFDQAVKSADKTLDDTDVLMERNLAATNRVNKTASETYSTGSKTSWMTWIIVFLMCIIFMMMVFLIRIT
ncbi:hypothetical protein CBR_g26495 [Chara braunii]|uniref:Vesicle transport protein USE1 n=1 Tax=Chara braunii TaxID=69332 RepID=A0A388L827_CHABU|nr:hypothetical protein CBR_g26495 [Chara braunii]|eukprot:GBG78465.1 hypothetical protein CBR_g26495 [Chara braunii]